MSAGYPANWDQIRREVYQRDNYTCQNCGAGGGSQGGQELHAHHIVPISSGGSHNSSNLITMCAQCHNAIHTDATAQGPTADFGGGVDGTGFGQAKHNEYFVKDKSRSEIKRSALPYYDELESLDEYTDLKFEMAEKWERYFRLVNRMGKVSGQAIDEFYDSYEEAKFDYQNTLRKMEEKSEELEIFDFGNNTQIETTVRKLGKATNNAVEVQRDFIEKSEELLLKQLKKDTSYVIASGSLYTEQSDTIQIIYNAFKEMGRQDSKLGQDMVETFGPEGQDSYGRSGSRSRSRNGYSQATADHDLKMMIGVVVAFFFFTLVLSAFVVHPILGILSIFALIGIYYYWKTEVMAH